jgi:hypothetical protein
VSGVRGTPGASLFDSGIRSQSAPSPYSESFFDFLNRMPGSYWQAVRDELDRWYQGVPADARGEIWSRLRSGESDFWGAFWELLLYELFVSADFDAEFHPAIQSGGKPDLAVSRLGTRYLVEATVLMEPASDARSELLRSALRESLKAVESAEFRIGILIRGENTVQPSGKRLAGQIQEWLDGLSRDGSVTENGSFGSAGESRRVFCDSGWRIEVMAYRKEVGDRKMTSGVSLGPLRGRFVTDHLAMRADLKKKAQKYRASKLSMVLAVMNARFTASDESIALALYGAAWEHGEMMVAGQIDKSWPEGSDGLWITRSGRQYEDVVAVIGANQLAPDSFGDEAIRVWYPPMPSAIIEGLPLGRVVPGSDGALAVVEPRSTLREIFGLPSDWPPGELLSESR